MPPRQIRPNCRALLLASTTLAALTSGAAAKDLPATSEGAAKITAFFETYAGKAAATPPALVVTPEGTDYLVAVDIGALTAPLKSAGLNYDPAVFKFKVFEQDDGGMARRTGDFPPYHVQMTQNNVTTDVAVSVSGLKSVTVIRYCAGLDPKRSIPCRQYDHARASAWGRRNRGGRPVGATMATQASADGAVSSTMRESSAPSR